MPIGAKPQWSPTGTIHGAIPDARREAETRRALMPPKQPKPVTPPTPSNDPAAQKIIDEVHQSALEYARRRNARIKK
jgi:hypothetical protein